MYIWRAVLIAVLAAQWAAAQEKPSPIPDDAELRPGLVGAYWPRGRVGCPFERIDFKPAFTCLKGVPDPRLGSEGFSISWSGLFFLREAEPVRFSAFVSGEIVVTIDGKQVLKGTGDSLTSRTSAADTFKREPGLYRVTIKYDSGDVTRVPSRLQLWWEG